MGDHTSQHAEHGAPLLDALAVIIPENRERCSIRLTRASPARGCPDMNENGMVRRAGRGRTLTRATPCRHSAFVSTNGNPDGLPGRACGCSGNGKAETGKNRDENGGIKHACTSSVPQGGLAVAPCAVTRGIQVARRSASQVSHAFLMIFILDKSFQRQRQAPCAAHSKSPRTGWTFPAACPIQIYRAPVLAHLPFRSKALPEVLQ